MSEELKCPNCKHDIGEHGGTGCTHMNSDNSWCRCKFSSCGINLNWLKGEYQSLRVELDALRSKLEAAKEALIISHDAIKSLPIDALGVGEIDYNGEPYKYPIRDEVIDKINKALKLLEAQP